MVRTSYVGDGDEPMLMVADCIAMQTFQLISGDKASVDEG